MTVKDIDPKPTQPKPKATRRPKPRPRAMVVCSFSLPTSFYSDLTAVSEKLRVSRSSLVYFLASRDLRRLSTTLDCLDFSDLSSDMVQNLRYDNSSDDSSLLDQRRAFFTYVDSLIAGVESDSTH